MSKSEIKSAEAVLNSCVMQLSSSFDKYYKSDVVKAMQEFANQFKNESDAVKKQLSEVNKLANSLIGKQEYNKHYLPHVFYDHCFSGSDILEVANKFKAILEPTPPKGNSKGDEKANQKTI